MIMSAAAAGKLAADNPQVAVVGVVAAGAVLYLMFSKWMDTSSGLLRDAGGAAKDAAKWTAKEVGEFGDYAEDKVEDLGRGAKKAGRYVGRSARKASKEAVKDTKSALRGAKRAVTQNRVSRGVKKTGKKAKKAAGKAKKALGRLFG